MSIGADGRVTSTTLAGAVTEEWVDSDSDLLFGDFIDLFAAGLLNGYARLPTLNELARSMTIVEGGVRRRRSLAGYGGDMGELSICDVARAAGLHSSTVSRAFTRPDAVNEKTRERILRRRVLL